MSRPSKPGWYSWRDGPTEPWECVEVWPDHDTLMAQSRLDVLVDAPPEPVAEYAGEWGERIPDSGTLAARRELAEADPTRGSKGMVCRYCHKQQIIPLPGNRVRLVEQHWPNCPWLRAQPSEKPDEKV